MKHIGMLHYKVGGVDGVSLEIEKWQHVLREMGHEVTLCAGDLGQAEGYCIPEMYHHTLQAERLYAESFIELQDSEAQYRAQLLELAANVEASLRDFVSEKEIDFLIPHNLWSVAMNPAVAIALANVVRDLQLPVLAQHHDFYWERIDGVALPCATAVELADKFLPPRDTLIQHAVINSLAQTQLVERKGLEAMVIPNVFDFEGPAWAMDTYNRDMRQRLGLQENDVVILQATRIVRRKGIELAVDFVRALDTPERRAQLQRDGLYDGRAFTKESRIVLVLAGATDDDPGQRYVDALRQKIAAAGIDALFIEPFVANERKWEDGRKIYSLWDTYTMADFVTYPSLWEGWGNQLLEALKAQLPFMLFEYPVYRADIGGKGIEAVSLGSDVCGRDGFGLVQVEPAIMEAAADQAVRLLSDVRLRAEMAAHNLAIAREYYSLTALRGYLEHFLAGK